MVSLTSSPTMAPGTGSDAEGGAADGGGGRKAGVRLVVHALNRSAGAFHIQHHGPGDAVQGQVSGHGQSAAILGHAGAGERGGGELGNVEEVIGLEVIVAGLYAGVDGGDVDGGRHGGLGDVGLVQEMVAATLPNRPWTLEMPRWRDAEIHFAVAGSEIQVEVVAPSCARRAEPPAPECQLQLPNASS